MGKMILITTDNEVKELEYPDVGLKSKYGNAGIEFCEMSEEQFNIVFPKLQELGKKFKDAGD